MARGEDEITFSCNVPYCHTGSKRCTSPLIGRNPINKNNGKASNEKVGSFRGSPSAGMDVIWNRMFSSHLVSLFDTTSKTEKNGRPCPYYNNFTESMLFLNDNFSFL